MVFTRVRLNVTDQISISPEFCRTQLTLESSFRLVNLGVASQVLPFGKEFWAGFWAVLALELLFTVMDNQVIEDSTLIPGDMGAEAAFEEDVHRGFW